MSSLTENFKIKNGLTVTSAVSAGSCVEADSFKKHGGTSSQFLKADGSVDSASYTTCTGTTTPSNTQTFTNKSGSNSQWTNDAGYTTCAGTVTSAGALLSGSATTIGVDSGALDYLNQSGCAGIDCTGTTTASNSQTFTNKAGNISQWTNDCAYTKCTGTLNPSGTIATNDFAKYNASGCLVGRSCAETRSDLGINTAASCTAASLDQSACAGILCTGTTTASNTQTFTNKSGSNSQWTNDAGYTDCVGTITCVSTTGEYLTGGGNSGVVNVGIDSACGAKWDTAAAGDISEVIAGTNLTGGGSSGSVTLNMATGGAGAGTYGETATGCKINTITIDSYGRVTAVACGSTGDIQGVTAGAGLSGGATSGTATVALDGAMVATLNQSGCAGINCTGIVDTSGTPVDNDFAKFTDANTIEGRSCSEVRTDLGIGSAASCTAASLDQSACPGIDCVGTQTGLSVTNGITSTGGVNPTICITSTCQTKFDQSTCAGINCTGTLVASDLDDLNALISCPGLDCVGTITSAGALLSGSATTLGVNSGALTYLNQSACAGLNCVGDVTGIDAGTAITVSDGTTATPSVGVTSTCNTAWNSAKSIADGLATCAGLACVGDITSVGTDGTYLTGGALTGAVTVGLQQSCADKWDNASAGSVSSVTGGDGITSSGGTTPSIAVDSTVARTDVAETFTNDVTVQGNLCVQGDLTCIDTVIETTSAIEVNNNGTGPALCVNQCGVNDIVNFLDDGTSSFYIENGGNVGINDTNPNERLDVNGNINVTGSYKMDDADVINSGKCFVGAGYAGGAIGDTYISSAATWNAKTTCTGTVDTSGTPVDNDFAKFTDANTIEGRSCSEVRTDLGINTAANCTAASLDQSACAGILCTGTTTPSNTQTFTNKSGSNNQWTNDAGYTDCVGTITAVNVANGIEGGGSSGSINLCVDSTVVRTTGVQVIGGSKHFTSNAVFPALSATGTISANCFAAGAFMEVNAPSDIVYPQGTVLAMNQDGCIVESTESNSNMVFGVAAGDSKAPVVMGAEPICITGCISVGDFITTSDCNGHGMKSITPYPFGTIIGQALESGGGDSYEIKAMIRKM